MTFDEIIGVGKQMAGAAMGTGSVPNVSPPLYSLDEFGPEETHTGRLPVGLTRKSPLGYTERVGDPETFRAKGGKAYTDPETLVSYYDARYWNDPSTQTHERIHAGQYRLPNKPTEGQVTQSLAPYFSRDKSVRYMSLDGKVKPEEAPAYAFQSVADPGQSRYSLDTGQTLPLSAMQQEAFNNYVDMTYRLNPGQSYHVEAPMPEELMREYVRSHPRPMVPPDPRMRERGLMETVWSAFGRRAR
jgi:hypothetical protein